MKLLKLTIGLVVIFTASMGFSQDDLNIFGYFQTMAFYNKQAQTISYPPLNLSAQSEFERKSFLVQQFNVFFRKELTGTLTAWANLEMTNSFSAERNWGTFNLQEAWVRYRRSAALNIKGGLLVPRFNNLNEVKNRMPYLPYITRPLVYETSISGLLDLEDFVPERAYLQMYGDVSVGDNTLDYAVYVGGGESEFHNDDDDIRAIQTGTDSTLIFLVGTRIGLRVNTVKSGISVTYDKDNLTPKGYGNPKRLRLGADLSFIIGHFMFEGEIVSVRHFDTKGAELDKIFYYATVGWDPGRWFTYVSYNYLQDELSPEARNGVKSYILGGGVRVADSLVLKTHYSANLIPNGVIEPSAAIPVPLKLELNFYSVAVAASVFF